MCKWFYDNSFMTSTKPLNDFRLNYSLLINHHHKRQLNAISEAEKHGIYGASERGPKPLIRLILEKQD